MNVYNTSQYVPCLTYRWRFYLNPYDFFKVLNFK